MLKKTYYASADHNAPRVFRPLTFYETIFHARPIERVKAHRTFQKPSERHHPKSVRALSIVLVSLAPDEVCPIVYWQLDKRLNGDRHTPGVQLLRGQ